MPTTVVVVLAAVLVAAVVLCAPLARPWLRRRRLRGRFGPEYERAVEQYGGRRDAERNLVDRERRFRDLDIRPLPDATRARYNAAWTAIQERFVDAPAQAVGEADDLITRLMHERGYPVGTDDRRMELLSVEHGEALEHYRAAHDIARRSRAGDATTEDLRQAVIHHRQLFNELLGTPGSTSPARPTV